MSASRDDEGHDSARRYGVAIIALAWVAVLGLLALAFGDFLAREANPNRAVEGRVTDAAREVVLAKNRSGHYVATGAINGVPVTFLLDTGATDVSVPARLAERLGLRAGQPVPARTANGVITTYATRLDRVELGPIALGDVRAHINPHMRGDEVLLGMSFLGELEFSQRGDELTIRQPLDA